MSACQCGCGANIPLGRAWAKGHNRFKGFWERTTRRESGCIEWAGPTRPDGYGKGPRGQLAHRFAYSLVHGDAGNLFVCHACDNPICVNPEHLWAGSQKDNMRDMAQKGRARGQGRTHCSQGHEFTPENTYWRPGKVASRDCRACGVIRVTSYQKRLRELAA